MADGTQTQPYKINTKTDGTIEVVDAKTGSVVPHRMATQEEIAGGAGNVVIEGAEDQEVIRDSDEETVWRSGPSGAVWRLNKADNTVEEYTVQEDLPSYIKRPALGAISPFVDSPGDFGVNGYFPAGVEAVPSALYSLYNLAADNSILPRAQNDYLDAATERTIGADQSVREAFNVTAPENAFDVALEIGGGLLMPGPKGLNNLSVTGRSGGLINNTLKVAGETLLPLRQGTMGGALATQVPLGVGISETLDTAIDNPEYEGIVDAVDDATTYQPTIVDGIPQDIVDGFLEEDDEAASEEMAQLILDGIKNGEFTAPEAEVPVWRKPAIVAASFLGLGLGVAGVRQATRASAQQRLNSSTSLTGVEVRPQSTNLGNKAIGGFVQGDQSIRAAVRDSGGTDAVIRRLDRATAPSMNSIQTHALATGEFPRSAITTQPVSTTLEAFAKDVDADEWTVVSEGLLAQNALDDIKANGVQSAFNDRTPAELQTLADRLSNDPKLARYGDAVKTHYRSNLDFMLEQGLINAEMHGAMTTARPNYVHMSRNVVVPSGGDTLFGGAQLNESARSHLNDMLTRSTDEFGGVQAGKAADPIRELVGQTAGVIRQAEINNLKKELFEIFEGNAAMSNVFKKIPAGETPRTRDGIHDIVVNGERQYYQVTDKTLDAALKFNPAVARSNVATVLSIPTRMTQFFLTGPGNPFFAATAAAYDTGAGMALRPRGYDLGLISEGLNTLMPRSGGLMDQVKALDPTALVSAPIGAVRLGYDEFIGGAARSLTEQLMRGDGILVRALGPQNATTLRNRLAMAYDGSVRSMMDKYGASTTGLLDSGNPNQQSRVMADLAPEFFTRSSRRAYEEAKDGGMGFVEGLMRGSDTIGNRVRASSISRLYMNTVRLLHEGFRYQAFATNLPKVRGDVEGLERIASQTRRISADVMQRGNASLSADLNSTALYANPAIQGLTQVTRQLKDQPVTTALNTAGLLSMMTILQYAAAADNPELQDEIRNMTDDEQTRQVKTFGGLSIPIPPELRLLWGPYAAMMNEITGLNGGQFDPNIGQVLDRWLDGETEISEEGSYSIAESLKSGLNNMQPVQIGSFPIVNAAMATQGVDLGMTRYTGAPQDIKQQELSGLGGDGQLVGDAISAQSMALIEELMSASIANYFRIGMDMDRAYDEGSGAREAVDVGLSRFRDNTVRSAGPLRGVLFGGYERVQSSNDTSTRLWFSKNEGIEKARNILRQDITQQFVTGADPRYALLKNTDTVPPNLSGTALAPIGAISADLLKAIRPLQTRANELRDQVSQTQNQRFSSIEDRNREVNEFNEERAEITEQMLLITQMAEDSIRQTIGDPAFSYQRFDPEKYKSIPYPAPTVQ